MKLTPEQLAEIEAGHKGKLWGENPFTYPRLFDHIRAVEAERDDWHTMAGRLAATLNEAAVIDNWGYFEGDEFFACLGDMSLARCCVFYRQDAMNVLEEHDALVARDVKS